MGVFAVFDPVVFSHAVDSPILPSHAVRERAGIATRIREPNHPDVLIMRAAMPAN
jgi:hypothetical protein